MPIIIPALFWVGVGAAALSEWLYKRIWIRNPGWGVLKWVGKSERNVLIVVLVIVLGVLLPKTLKPQRFDKIGILEVGKWISENSGKKEPAVFSTSSRNAYYAGARAVQMNDLNTALSQARKENADYILLTRRERAVLAAELKKSIMRRQTALVYTVEDSKNSGQGVLFLYKVIY